MEHIKSIPETVTIVIHKGGYIKEIMVQIDNYRKDIRYIII